MYRFLSDCADYILCFLSILQHIGVISYYLRKKSRLRCLDQYKYITVNFFQVIYINIVYKRYYCAPADETLTTQDHVGCGVAISC